MNFSFKILNNSEEIAHCKDTRITFSKISPIPFHDTKLGETIDGMDKYNSRFTFDLAYEGNDEGLVQMDEIYKQLAKVEKTPEYHLEIYLKGAKSEENLYTKILDTSDIFYVHHTLGPDINGVDLHDSITFLFN